MELSGATSPSVPAEGKRMSVPVIGTQYNDMLPPGDIDGTGVHHPSCPKCVMSDYEWSDDSDSKSSSSSEDLDAIMRKKKKTKQQNGKYP